MSRGGRGEAATGRGPRIRAVVFDLFDTLVDLSMDGLPPIEVNGRRWPSTAGALHRRVTAERALSLEEFVGALRAVDEELRGARAEAGRELATLERFEALAERLGLRDPALPRELTELHMTLFRGQVTHLPHHPEVLAALSESARLAVCSNFSHSQTALRVLEEGGMRWRFDAVVVSDAVGYRKPRPEIFHAVLAALGLPPEQVLHVGDSLSADVAGAAASGMRTGWVTRRVADPGRALAEYTGPEPDYTVADLGELVALLRDG